MSKTHALRLQLAADGRVVGERAVVHQAQVGADGERVAAAAVTADSVAIRVWPSALPARRPGEAESGACDCGSPAGSTRNPIRSADEPIARVWRRGGGAPHGGRTAIGVAAAVVVSLLALTGYLIFGGSPTTRQVEVPNVAGQQPEVAARAAGGEPARHAAAGGLDRRREGQVIDTDPAAGSQVPERSTVTLQVGNGPDQAAVPPLTGRTVAEAGPLLTERGPVLGAQTEQITSDASQVGKILSSTPAAGENVPAGTAVAVVVGKQQTTVPVPNVVGQDYDHAKRELEDASFTVRSTSIAGGTAAEVASTDPPAGTQAPLRSTITLRVFLGP